ncbi:MAG: prolyl oligopeptidase family serine peptidase, partial [Pirellulaceae bacterium]|nr:prolyl oligopeptidase family serine peptidase [Pirellulaceae bacterium]
AMFSIIRSLTLLLAICTAASCLAQETKGTLSTPPFGIAYRNTFGKFPTQSTDGDRIFADYFRMETQRIDAAATNIFSTREEWDGNRELLRKQLFEMLSLDPLPSKTDLHATITGTLDHDDFIVQKLHFQSRPGLYATANVYVPKKLDKPAPAILYVCGHGRAQIDGINYGNKTTYQHHGAWFAKNGYICLILDSVQLGEIEGIHHGTHHEGMWWWNSRGYTSAGAEAWNCIRALDYLQTRSEVDPQRLGVTGRSGGGAYSWWIAALDERIQAACPVAGITDLQNHVVDGCVEGHCDCMFTVNTYRWSYDRVAALVAPRPLLICNSDKDRIFPLDGIVRLHAKVRKIYDLYDAPDKLGLLITEGPHKDTQELQLPVMRWFNKWLKNDESPVASYAEKLFTPQELKVFDKLPDDEITSRCFENFTRLATDSNSFDPVAAVDSLRSKTFGAWPASDASQSNMPLNLRKLSSEEANGVRLSVHEFESQPGMRLRFYLAQPADVPAESLHIEIVDASNWMKQLELGRVGFSSAMKDELASAGIDVSKPVDAKRTEQFQKWMQATRDRKTAYITFTPRGVGMTALGEDVKYQTHVRRRFMLLGGTLASSQVWDLRRATSAAQSLPNFNNLPLHWHASPDMTEVAAFATLLGNKVDSVSLAGPPRQDKESPDFLNWSRIVTPNQLLELIQSKTVVKLPKKR